MEASACRKYRENPCFLISEKIPAERKLNHPFAESTKWKQQLAESTIFHHGDYSAGHYSLSASQTSLLRLNLI
jgi:hypothetical protein